MNEEAGLSQRTLEVNGKLIAVSPDILLEKIDGRRVAITRSEAIDVADVD